MVKKTSNNKSLAENTRLLSEFTGTGKTPDIDTQHTKKRIVLFIAVLSGFITPFDGSAVNIALPSMGKEFHMDAIALSWVATAYLLAAAIFLVPFGKIADI
jgi:Major Facilitator Superfamily